MISCSVAGGAAFDWRGDGEVVLEREMSLRAESSEGRLVSEETGREGRVWCAGLETDGLICCCEGIGAFGRGFLSVIDGVCCGRGERAPS